MLKKTFFFLLLTVVLFSGCIRLTGNAGYYTEKDGEVKSKQAGFDTNDLIPGQPKGSIN